MLRISAEESPLTTRFRLEGRLKGPWVSELEALYLARKRASVGKSLIVDIQGVTATDDAGRYLLALIQREGATLAYSGSMPTHLLGNSAFPVEG